uniref:WD_REPEATS_REGION domain-containing protein n=1 Tax=Panagrellus redivivus TaxID=6233 RepID=A0A7E4VU00_PANRE
MLKSAVRVDPIPFDVHKAGSDVEPFHYLHDPHTRCAKDVRWLNTGRDDKKRVVYSYKNEITYAEFDKRGVDDGTLSRKPRYTVELEKSKLQSDEYTCLSNGRNGFIAYGTKSGNLGLLRNDPVFEKLDNIPMVYKRRDEVSAIDCTDTIVVSSDQRGVISAMVINAWRNFRHDIGRNDNRATSIHVADDNTFFTGHSNGLVSLWDMRVPIGNVWKWWEVDNPPTKEFYRNGFWNPVTSLDSRANYMFVCACDYYPQVHFGDIRMPKDKYDCTLTLKHPVVKARFHDFRTNIVNVITRDGYVELDNHKLESIWWDGKELDVPAWLRGCDYDKVIRASESLIRPIDFDSHGRDIVIMNVGGDMNYIHGQ